MKGSGKMALGVIITALGLVVYLIGMFELKNVTQIATVCYSGLGLVVGGFIVLLMGSFDSVGTAMEDCINSHYDEQKKRIDEYYENKNKPIAGEFPGEII